MKANSRKQRAIHGGKREGCTGEGKHGEALREKKGRWLEKGQKLDSSLRSVRNWQSIQMPPKLLSRSHASMGYPRRHLFCSEREGFSTFLSISTGMKQKLLQILPKKDSTKSPSGHQAQGKRNM